MADHREIAFEAVIDALAAGVLLTDRQGHVLYMNRSARSHVEASDVVCLINQRLNAVDRGARYLLTEALADHRGGPGDTPPCAFSIALPGIETRGLVATVLPLNQCKHPGCPPEETVAVFLEAPVKEAHLPGEAFAHLFGLTRGELRMLISISLTSSTIETATEMGVRRSTTKTHLSHIYAKTGTSKLSELLPLFMHSVLRRELIDTPFNGDTAR